MGSTRQLESEPCSLPGSWGCRSTEAVRRELLYHPCCGVQLWITSSALIIEKGYILRATQMIQRYSSPSKDGETVIGLARTALRVMKRWFNNTGPSVETELVISTGKKKWEGWKDSIFDGILIKPMETVKHLGIILNAKLNCGHMRICGRTYSHTSRALIGEAGPLRFLQRGA